MPKPTTTAHAAAPFDAARAFYAEAFEPKKRRELAESLADWSEMTEDEQSFTTAHLLYLNLQAQAVGHRLIAQVRDLLDEVAEGLTTAIEASLTPEPPPDVFDAASEVDLVPPPSPPVGGEE